MAAEQPKETRHDQVESSIDDLILEILNEAGTSPKSAGHGGPPMTALIETAITSPRIVSRSSTLERFLIAETFASVLADALAPALAEVLAPRIMKVLEQSTTREPAHKEQAPTASSSERTRKSEKG